MGKKTLWRGAVAVVLAGLSAACTLFQVMGVEGVVTATPPPTEAPTLAPSLAPNEEALEIAPTGAPAAAADVFPKILRGTARSTAYGSDGNPAVYCLSDARATLVLQGDGRAQLSVTGPQFFDHINCTDTGAEITWLLDGADSPAEESARFPSCNNGRLKGSGQVSYRGGALSGEVTCLNPDGKMAVRLVFGP